MSIANQIANKTELKSFELYDCNYVVYFSCAQKHADQTIELLIGLPSTLSLFGLEHPSLGVKPFCTIRLLKEPRQVESKIRKEPVVSNVLFYNFYIFVYMFFPVFFTTLSNTILIFSIAEKH